MGADVDPAAHNRIAWDRRVDEGDEWTRPVSAEVISRAREGDWSVVLIGYHPVDRSWFPPELRGADILCLASGGGQQGPTLAAAGARVTVFDNSPRQLAQDELVAARDGLTLHTVLGDMRDLGVFADESFDVVFNPDLYIFDAEALDSGGEFVVRHRLPYSDLADLPAAERERLFGPEAPVEYSHTLGEQIGGQLAAGFVLTGFA